MKICFKVAPNGDHLAITQIPVAGGHVRLTARVTDRELREMYARYQCPPTANARARRARGRISGDDIGWGLSFKSLGRAIKKIAKPAALLKITSMAARLAAGDPTMLLAAPGILRDVKRGLAAKKVMSEAQRGNPRAVAIMRRARAAAARGSAMPALPGVEGGVMRYLVTLQRLAA